MKRIHIQNATSMIEFPDTPEGEAQALQFRKTNPAFARRRLKRVVQLLPSQIPCGVVIELA